MNNTIIIPFSKKKMVKLLGLYILVILGIAAIIFFILSADRINLYYLALFVVLFIAGAYLFYKHIQELWAEQKERRCYPHPRLPQNAMQLLWVKGR